MSHADFVCCCSVFQHVSLTFMATVINTLRQELIKIVFKNLVLQK